MVGWRTLRIVAAAAAVVAVGCGRPPRVTTESLLHDMTDLAGLAEFPEPPFTCRQASSYDRASVSPSQGDAWFANGDTGQFIREEMRAGHREYVMMEADGPGAIVRIWSANPKGTIRIYLDRQEPPALEVPMEDLLGGKVEGIPPPIAGVRSRGWNCYYPFAYARHCKVTSDRPGFYYHVNYRTYGAGVGVETFRPETLERCAARARQVAQSLDACMPGLPPAGIAAAAPHSFPLTIEPGRAAACGADNVAGAGGAVSFLAVSIDSPAGGETYRRVILEMEFDGQKTVEAPLGDFFGAGPQAAAYGSLPMGVSAGGDCWSNWLMPFQRGFRITLRNTSGAPVRATVDVTTAPRAWTDRSMYFHAKWRGERAVPTRPMQDWNYLTATGRGVFVGAALTIANPVKAWWGEGDEKIYVDGERFPSHFGTGTEDYFGYAWCSNEPFEHAYHNQPRCDGPGNHGWTTVNRWHVTDRIPFTRSIRFDMELWHWHESTNVDMSVVSYWYARPGGADGFRPIEPEALALRSIAPYEPQRVAGAIEGEEMRIVEKTGVAGPQGLEFCSNERQLWWRGKPAEGDRLELGFEPPAAGRFRVRVRCVSAPDYGIHQLWINGEKAGAPVDFYSPTLGHHDELDLGVHALQPGENRLRVEALGSNPAALKERMFGLDYIRLEAGE